MVDDDDPLGEGLAFLQVVAGEHHGAAAVVVAADRVPQGVAGLDVQAGGRFVEQDQVGAADEGEGDREPALLPSGQSAGLAPLAPGQGELFQQLTGRHGVEEVAGGARWWSDPCWGGGSARGGEEPVPRWLPGSVPGQVQGRVVGRSGPAGRGRRSGAGGWSRWWPWCGRRTRWRRRRG